MDGAVDVNQTFLNNLDVYEELFACNGVQKYYSYGCLHLRLTFVCDVCRTRLYISGLIAAISWRVAVFNSSIVLSWYLYIPAALINFFFK